MKTSPAMAETVHESSATEPKQWSREKTRPSSEPLLTGFLARAETSLVPAQLTCCIGSVGSGPMWPSSCPAPRSTTAHFAGADHGGAAQLCPPLPLVLKC